MHSRIKALMITLPFSATCSLPPQMRAPYQSRLTRDRFSMGGSGLPVHWRSTSKSQLTFWSQGLLAESIGTVM